MNERPYATAPRFQPARGWRRATANFVSRATIHVAGKPTLRRQTMRLMKGLGGGFAYAAVVEPRWIERTHVEFRIPGLAPEMDGYRIVHLTDIHHNFVANRRFLERIIDMSNALDPDLYLVTGDFVTHNAQRIWTVMEVLSHLNATDGVLASRGNHDYIVPLETMRAACSKFGIKLLENEHVVVDVHRHRLTRDLSGVRKNLSLVVGAVGDLWMGVCDVSKAFDGAPAGIPRLLMAHNPWTGEIVHEAHQVALQFSGHTHGGQLRPFNKPLRLLCDTNVKYSAGIVQAPATTVYISRGVGTSALHFRWNCRPEIALITLKTDD